VDIKSLKRGLIVSCQAVKGDPFYGSESMAKMAIAAEHGGAVGVRVNTAEDIIEVKRNIAIPVIGLLKRRYEHSLAYITPTMKEVEEIVEAGADILCIDGTDSIKPDGKTTEEFVRDIKKRFTLPILADISTAAEGVSAWNYGVDILATTLAGYDHYLKNPSTYDLHDNFKEPDFEIINNLVNQVEIPVFAEGRFWTPEHIVKGLQSGAHSIVVGSAITRPQLITKRMTMAIEDFLEKR
jgi:N-acylglucosamine-6-phosphate 2-epimerase